MDKYTYVLLLGFIQTASVLPSAIAQTENAGLVQTLRSGHYEESVEALSEAARLNRQDLLLVAMENPSVWIRVKAANLYCKFPNQNAIDALVTLMRKDSLWVEEDGGRNNVVQHAFIESFKDDIKKYTLIDASNINLSDRTARRGLIQRLFRRED